MAYQNVGTPIFYIDQLLWLKSLGLGSSDIPIFDLNPSLQYNSTVATGTFQHQWFYDTSTPIYNIGYLALLGHSGFTNEGHLWLKVNDSNFTSEHPHGETLDVGGYPLSQSSLATINFEGGYNPGEYNGFSLRRFDPFDITGLGSLMFYSDTASSYNRTIGCISMGAAYTMPHSPDLSLTLTREYGGIKTIETKGGASLSNSFYHGSPAWGNLGAWELGGESSLPSGIPGSPEGVTMQKSGRRIWDLSFSYLSDSSVFPETSALSNLGNSDFSHSGDAPTESEAYLNTLLTDDNFYSQVIHKTNGGQLPFIFQPDGSNNNPDQFAICKFDMKNFKFEQVANGVYNVKLKIREVW